MGKLTDKQERFCLEYLKDSNATKAAIRAGYSEKTAYSIGQENLKKPEIQDYINSFTQKIVKEAKVTVEELVLELKKIAFSNIKGFINSDDLSFKNLNDISDEDSAAISSISIDEFQGGKDGRAKSKKVKFTLHNKLDAIEKLAKHIGFYEKDNNQKVSDRLKVILEKE